MSKLIKNIITPRLQPYWDNRYNLFSKFDDGIKFDAEGLWSLKPEYSTKKIADLINGKKIIDAFCGLGGSSIAFALNGKEVIAIENDEYRIECAIHNAELYGVSDKINFILEDCLNVIEQLDFDSMYVDPPWVGNEFFIGDKYNGRRLSDKSLFLLEIAKRKKISFGCTVPNTFDYNQIRDLEHNFYVNFDFFNGRNIYSTFFIDFRNQSEQTNGTN